MKTVLTAVCLILFALPAKAGIDPLPKPLGIAVGSDLPTVLATLKKLKAVITTDEKKQPGVHGSPYTYTRVKASLSNGPIERVKLYFYDQKLARMQVLSSDQRTPILLTKFGKASLESPTGRQFWWNRDKLTGVSCYGLKSNASSTPAAQINKGECEIFDMRVLVNTLGNRQQIEVQFQLLVQGTNEKVNKLKQPTR